MEAVSPVLPISKELDRDFAACDGSDRYSRLPTFSTEHSIITRWQLTPAEREHIAAGGDLFIAILNYGKAIWPIMPIVADPDTALSTVLEMEANL